MMTLVWICWAYVSKLDTCTLVVLASVVTASTNGARMDCVVFVVNLSILFGCNPGFFCRGLPVWLVRRL